MTTLRNRVIRLAHNKPELRAALLPILKEAISKEDAKKTRVSDTAIRTAYYKASDGLGALVDAVRDEPATGKDAKLKKAVADAKAAFDKVDEALKPYAWD
jgi:hypothetical protein